MRQDILRGMLLINEPSVVKLYQEMTSIAQSFVAPVFLIALIIEFFGEMNFGGVVKKLLIVTLFMTFFYQFHEVAVSASLKAASETLQRVSPRNVFVKKWHEVKLRTKEKKEWSLIEKFAVPNLNDLVATAFFLMAKVFILLLKLIFSTVYYFTYVFSGITAVLYFLGWTKDALKATVQGSLWCMLMPFVLVAIICLVGNSLEDTSSSGELVLAKIDTIVWLFGVTLMMLLTPLISLALIKGEGIQAFGSKFGQMVTSSAIRTASMAPAAMLLSTKVKDGFEKLRDKATSSRSTFKLGGSRHSNSLSQSDRQYGSKESQSTKSSNEVSPSHSHAGSSDVTRSASETKGIISDKKDIQKYSNPDARFPDVLRSHNLAPTGEGPRPRLNFAQTKSEKSTNNVSKSQIVKHGGHSIKETRISKLPTQRGQNEIRRI